MKKILLLSGVSLLVIGSAFYIKTQIDLAKSFCTKTKGFKLLKIGPIIRQMVIFHLNPCLFQNQLTPMVVRATTPWEATSIVSTPASRAAE